MCSPSHSETIRLSYKIDTAIQQTYAHKALEDLIRLYTDSDNKDFVASVMAAKIIELHARLSTRVNAA